MSRFLVSASLALTLVAGPLFAGTSSVLQDRVKSAAGVGAYQLAQSCGSGMNVCPAGDYGPGGCFKPGFATCTAGLVCTGGMQACAPSNGALPYCYKPGHGTCN